MFLDFFRLLFRSADIPEPSEIIVVPPFYPHVDVMEFQLKVESYNLLMELSEEINTMSSRNSFCAYWGFLP